MRSRDVANFASGSSNKYESINTQPTIPAEDVSTINRFIFTGGGKNVTNRALQLAACGEREEGCPAASVSQQI